MKIVRGEKAYFHHKQTHQHTRMTQNSAWGEGKKEVKSDSECKRHSREQRTTRCDCETLANGKKTTLKDSQSY
jgi:hypothetical protein